MRLDNPHRESFTYFACRLREDEELCEADPDLLISRYNFTQRGAKAVGAHVRNTVESLARVHRLELELEAERYEFDISHPYIQTVIERYASKSVALDFSASLRLPRPAERIDDGNWRPQRDTAIDVTFGAWLASGAKGYSTAAALLNDHRPRIEPRQGATDRSAVRRAVSCKIAELAFPRGAFRDRPLDYYQAVAFLNVHATRTALVLWRKLHAEKGRNSVYAYWQALRRDGRLFELAAELGETVTPDRAAFHAELENLVAAIHCLISGHVRRLARKHGVFENPGELANATNTQAQ
jgi:hypothetical protein